MVKLILLIICFIVLLGIFLWYISNVKKTYKQEQDDFNNANHLQQSNMKKYQTEANKMFTEKLENSLTPLHLTESFIKDYEQWQNYAWQEKEINTPEKDWNIGKSYDNLILKYCGKEKQYQNLAYGNDAEKWEDFKVLENTIEGNNAKVKVEYTNPQFSFIQRVFAFHFKKANRWLLEEKYYIDNEQQKLPYL